jgi:hypothetical protein
MTPLFPTNPDDVVRLITIAANASYDPNLRTLVIRQHGEIVAEFRCPESKLAWTKLLVSLGLANMTSPEYSWELRGTTMLMWRTP